MHLAGCHANGGHEIAASEAESTARSIFNTPSTAALHAQHLPQRDWVSKLEWSENPYAQFTVDLLRQADGIGTEAAWILFELKTETASCDDLQIAIYKSALDLGMRQLLDDLRLIANSPYASPKYKAMPKLDRYPPDAPVELVYLAPCRKIFPDARMWSITFQDLEALELPEYPEVWDIFRSIVLPALVTRRWKGFAGWPVSVR